MPWWWAPGWAPASVEQQGKLPFQSQGMWLFSYRPRKHAPWAVAVAQQGGPGWPLSLSSVEDGSCPVNGLVSATSATSNRCSWYRSATVAEDWSRAQAPRASSLCCP